MDFISITYPAFLLSAVVIYYRIPKNKQWISLLVFSILFYLSFSLKAWVFFFLSAGICYLYGVKGGRSKRGLIVSVFLILLLLVALKLTASELAWVGDGIKRFHIWLPIGISFYSLQMIAYMTDVYRGKYEPEPSFFKHLLFFLFFPQILQGPIPRFERLSPQLFGSHEFDERNLCCGFYLILWGAFQKMVIADRCNIVVNSIFDRYMSYQGAFFLIAGLLYSLQLYTDFAGCVYIALGSAKLFGIHLDPNFNTPYFSVGIRDFWRRWHMSLSSFLRDYVYIPLGGNRKGTLCKYRNILFTFIVSGLWHGLGTHFLVWGLLHGCYQVLEQMLSGVFGCLSKVTGITKEKGLGRVFLILVTDFFVMIAWIFFRAKSTSQAVYMTVHMFDRFNPWIFFDGELEALGISRYEWGLLILCVLLLILVGYFHEKGIRISKRFLEQPVILRFAVLLLFMMLIAITGIYGPGYDSAQFIYGGF